MLCASTDRRLATAQRNGVTIELFHGTPKILSTPPTSTSGICEGGRLGGDARNHRRETHFLVNVEHGRMTHDITSELSRLSNAMRRHHVDAGWTMGQEMPMQATIIIWPRGDKVSKWVYGLTRNLG